MNGFMPHPSDKPTQDTVARLPGVWRAFTLVELLVVVALITVLVAVLLPAMRGARAAARSAVCQSNLRQWVQVTLLYTSDNFGNFPLYTSNVVPTQRLRPYYQVEKFKLCPEATTPYGPPKGGIILGGACNAYIETRFDTDGDGKRDWDVGSYTWNGICNARSAWPTLTSPTGLVPRNVYIPAVSLAKGKVPLWGDGAWTAAFPGALNGSGDQPEAEEWGPTATQDTSYGLPRYAIRRHFNNSINLGLVDGHTESTSLPNIWVNYRWNAVFQIGLPAPTIPWL